MTIQRFIRKIAFLGLLFTGTVMAAQPLVGVVVSMESEAKYVCAHNFNDCKHSSLKNGMNFYTGHFANQPALLIISGVGLVNSAIATSTLIDNYHPNIIVLLGSSGGINSRVEGDVVIGGKVFNLDFGSFNSTKDQPTYPQGNHSDLFDPNTDKYEPLVLGTTLKPASESIANKTVMYFKQHPLPPEIKGAEKPTVKVGIIADSSIFYTPDSMTAEIKKAGVDAIAFEDIGFLQTCWSLKTKCVTFRSVSNALPASKANPPASASYAGQNAALVAQQYLDFLFQKD